MGIGYRSSLAVVVAAVLSAAAWPICDQLAGLGVAASSTVAGILATAAFGITLRSTRLESLSVRRLPSVPGQVG